MPEELVDTHPLYNPATFFRYDLGVAELDTPMVMSQYGALPRQDQLDSPNNRRGQQEVGVTVVGYGMRASVPDSAAWKDQPCKIRMVSYPQLVEINVPGYTGNYSMRLSNNANSGGPNTIGTSNVIAGVTSFARNDNCARTDGVCRIDRADDLDWPATFDVVPHVL
jgi:hypothetical protein